MRGNAPRVPGKHRHRVDRQPAPGGEVRTEGVSRLVIALHEPATWTQEWMGRKRGPVTGVACEGQQERNGKTCIASCCDGSPAAPAEEPARPPSPAAFSICEFHARPDGPQQGRLSHCSKTPDSGRSIHRESGTDLGHRPSRTGDQMLSDCAYGPSHSSLHTRSNQKLRRWNGYPGTEMRRRASPAKSPAKSSASPVS